MKSRASRVAVFAMILLSTGLLFLLMMPSAKSLPLLIILFGAGALLIPFVLMSKPDDNAGCDDPNGCDGRSISCCAGPRPVGTLGKKAVPHKKPAPTRTKPVTNTADPFIVGSISGPFDLDLPDIDG